MRVEKISDILHSYFNIGSDGEAMIEYMNCAEEILLVCYLDNMIYCVEGYKMFMVTMKITPKNPKFEPYEIDGTWLYKPDTKCWYCKGSSYMEDICTIKEALEL